MKKLLFFLSLGALFFSVNSAAAAAPPEAPVLKAKIESGVLTLPTDGGGKSGLRLPKDVEEIVGLERTEGITAIGAVVKWTNFALGFVAVIAIAFIIYGGFLTIMSGDDEGGTKKATTIIKNAIVGIIVIISAYAIVNTLLA